VARRLIEQGGAFVNQKRVVDIEAAVTEADLENNFLTIRAGKKRYHRIRFD
jgi:tyrosyl-tRNA synthetase